MKHHDTLLAALKTYKNNNNYEGIKQHEKLQQYD